jgi:uncharacterized protein (TIGR01589 family)
MRSSGVRIHIVHPFAQVQHLIEKCICYDMDKEECVKALEKHANIMPAVTSTGNSCFRLQLRIASFHRQFLTRACAHGICKPVYACFIVQKGRKGGVADGLARNALVRICTFTN